MKRGNSSPMATFSFAALLMLYTGKSETNFTPNDTAEFVDFIRTTYNANDTRAWVAGIVQDKKMWTEDFSILPRFIDEVSSYASLILEQGMSQALKQLLNNE